MKLASLWISLSSAIVLALFVACTEDKPESPEAPAAKKIEGPIKVLLVDGQNNHKWEETTPVLVDILEGSGRFEVVVITSPPSAPKAPRAPQEKTPQAEEKFASDMKGWEAAMAGHKEQTASAWEVWRPDFASYDVVVSNYNGELWPEEVRKSFEEYVAGGGGFVSVHAANNSFPEWPAYNEMIGVGGWGGRSELSGPYLRLREGEWVQDTTPGKGGSHGKRHEFVVRRENSHPIVDGLPEKWLHAEDELYDRLRGPAENVTVLAAALATTDTGGSGEWEPLLMTISHGEGRVFHTTLGHDTVAMGSAGFAETLKRGTEWAASGVVGFEPVGSDKMPLETVGLR